MWAYHLKTWLEEAQEEDNSDPSSWHIILDMVQLEFETGELSTEFTWATIVLMPEGGGKYHGIGLLGVIRKVIAIII